MEAKLSSVVKTLKPSPIQQLSYLAERSNAINLTEGFPDFPAPPYIKAAAGSAITSDFNQYRYGDVGFQVQFIPMGSFFIFATLPDTCKLMDVEFVEELIKEAGVVVVPGCGFFHTS